MEEDDDDDEIQRDTLISQIYFWNGALHVLNSFSVHHQESRTVHIAIFLRHTGFFRQLASGIRIPLASCHQNLYDVNHCCVYSSKLLMMDREIVRNI